MPASEGEQQDVTSNDREEMQTETPPEETRREPVHVIFDITEEVPQDSQNDDEPLKPSDIREWLHIHEKLGHMSWNQMKLLVEQGILSKKYKNCKALKCPRCLYGKQHRTPWRTSKRNRKKLKIALKPGDCVSVDIMQSSVDGFVPQQKGSILTTSHFVGAVIFVDHKTDFTSAVPITSLMSQKKFLKTHGMTTNH